MRQEGTSGNHLSAVLTLINAGAERLEKIKKVEVVMCFGNPPLLLPCRRPRQPVMSLFTSHLAALRGGHFLRELDCAP